MAHRIVCQYVELRLQCCASLTAALQAQLLLLFANAAVGAVERFITACFRLGGVLLLLNLCMFIQSAKLHICEFYVIRVSITPFWRSSAYAL